jgi:biotin-(acetyl-CoA carboxylase) ligase
VKNPDARQSILRRFEENSSSVRGKQVSVEDNARLMGITEGLDQQGFLRVRTEDGLQTIVSGTVRMEINL